MHANPISQAAVEERSEDNAVLRLLVEDDHVIWSVDEITRELDDVVGAADALSRLHGAGLVHRIENFVFASHAAIRAHELR